MSAPAFSKRELLIFLYKYRPRLLLAFFAPLLLAVAVSFIPTPRYQAESVLMVRMGSEYVYQPELGNANNGAAAFPLSNEQIAKSEEAILESDDLHAQIIRMIGLEKLFPSLAHPQGLARVITAIGRGIEELTAAFLRNPPPEMSERQRLARAVALFDKHFDVRAEKDSSVIRVRFEHPDAAVATATLDALLSAYFDKRKQLYLQPRAVLAQQEMEATRNQSLAAGKAIEEFKRTHNIYALEAQRADLLKWRDAALQQSAEISNPGLDRHIAEYNQQLDQLDADERELNVLQKEADIASATYGLYAGKLDEAKAYDNLQRERADSVRIIQPPIAPAEPRRLQPLIIIAGLFLSLLCAATAAVATEFSRSGFLTPEQVERELGLPVLAALPLWRH